MEHDRSYERYGGVVRKKWSMLVTVLAGLLLAGCPAGSTEPLEYRIGVARIDDDYHLFAPVCPGDALAGVRVSDTEGDLSGADDPSLPDASVTWWAAGGPKDPAGRPHEFVRLGDDGPFHHIAVAAGGNQRMPADFRATTTYTDGHGGELDKSITLRLSAVPTYPAGTDPRQVLYLTRPLGDMGNLARPEQIRSHSDCADPTETPLRQAAGSLRSEAPGRVDRAMLESGAVSRLVPVAPRAAPAEDVAAHLCGNGPGFGALVAAFGREQVWREPEFDVETGAEVRQFAGAYGRIAAAEAIDQVDGRFGCTRYTDGTTGYTGTHRIGLPALPGVDRHLLYCEESEHGAGRCTLLLARGDILSRLVVHAATGELAQTSARALADDAAAALAG
jgi:hypothetical protein